MYLKELFHLWRRVRDYERDRKNTLKNVGEEYQEIVENLARIINILYELTPSLLVIFHLT